VGLTLDLSSVIDSRGVQGGFGRLGVPFLSKTYSNHSWKHRVPSRIAKLSSIGLSEYCDEGSHAHGVAQTAANVDKSWIGTDACDVISAELQGRPVTILNDADAAGLAEERYGAGKNRPGLVVVLTFGTGIGSAVIHDGTLIPNTELGHLEVGGKEAEQRAASSVKDRNGWSYEKWAKQVTRVLVAIENTMWPDLFIVGGGISRKAEKWVPLLQNRTPVVAAALQNTAGIVGAAMAATISTTH
jgi:polyphosphate glucokinase